MHIVCLVKFVPDVDNFSYNYETHTIIRQDSSMNINPDDACALGFALNIKKKNPDTFIEVISMAPKSLIPQIENILRVGFDKATLISDSLYAGSDTYVTSKILSKHLSTINYDCILSGTHSIDGDTSHVPSQIAQCLKLDHLNSISKIDETSFGREVATVNVENENSSVTYEIKLPAILSLTRESNYRLPYVRYKNLNLDVSDKIQIISNKQLKFDESTIGIKGSLTKVNSTHVKKYETRDKKIVQADEEGVQVIYEFLKEKGFI
ncbi:MAG: electron transfer flavoprotein subunit beta/FixA family protein [Pleomorphochaeta sp.]